MIDFKNVRIPWQFSPYPFYHEGLYLEENFYDFYIKNKPVFDTTGYTLIPIFWTTAYLHQINLTEYINALPKTLKYFCIVQHDDGIKETLPEDTIVFSAGGNNGGIPLPLVCSPIPKNILPTPIKDIFCSFIGSLTHDVRERMSLVLKQDSRFYIKADSWTLCTNTDKQTEFLNITSRSKFTLCPRGYGAQSFRFYEALQMKSIPVYIHDDNKWLPYSDILDWTKFSIALHINDIQTLPALLESFSDEQIKEMVNEGTKAYDTYFNIMHLPFYVLNYLKQKSY